MPALDIVPDIVPDNVIIVYINLTCHLDHAGPSLQRHGISVSNDDEDRQMDDDYLRQAGQLDRKQDF